MQVKISKDLYDILDEYERYCCGEKQPKEVIDALVVSVLVDFINEQEGRNHLSMKLRKMYNDYLVKYGK